jgi:hypothetical protein
MVGTIERQLSVNIKKKSLAGKALSIDWHQTGADANDNHGMYDSGARRSIARILLIRRAVVAVKTSSSLNQSLT